MNTIAVLCPVCQGSGLVHSPLVYNVIKPCHGCAEWGSKGWLLIAPKQRLVPEELITCISWDGTSIPIRAGDVIGEWQK